MDEKHYCCPHCDWRIKLSHWIGALKYHIDTNHPEAGEKKYFCNKCEKGFMYKTSIGTHVSKVDKNKIHGGMIPTFFWNIAELYLWVNKRGLISTLHSGPISTLHRRSISMGHP